MKVRNRKSYNLTDCAHEKASWNFKMGRFLKLAKDETITAVAMAERLGVTESTIYRLCRLHGIELARESA